MKIWQMIRSHLLWLLSASFLIGLFFASSTDLLITEQSSEVSRISVILDDVSDVNYENFRKGAEQAALEAYQKAERDDSSWCFPNKLEDILSLCAGTGYMEAWQAQSGEKR